jgi:hypothetical protein
MGGGADSLPQGKSHSTPGVRPGHSEKALFYQWIREAMRKWRVAGGPWCGGLVTEIIDRRQPAVMQAARQAPRLQARAHRRAAEAEAHVLFGGDMRREDEEGEMGVRTQAPISHEHIPRL